MITHRPYPSDVPDTEWQFVVPYLCLLPEDAGQRVHNLRDVFDAARWLAAGGFEAIVHDLRAILRFADGRDPEPTAAFFDGRTLQSTPESGGRAGYDGAKRKKGSKVHAAVDTLGPLLALHVTPADPQDRDRVAALAEAVQEANGSEWLTMTVLMDAFTGRG